MPLKLSPIFKHWQVLDKDTVSSSMEITLNLAPLNQFYSDIKPVSDTGHSDYHKRLVVLNKANL